MRFAPIKSQCSGSYFYGNDSVLEHMIQTEEMNYANALRSFLSKPSVFTESQKEIFKRFWLFQNLRTEAAARRAIEMTSFSHQIGEPTPEDFNYGIKEAVQHACRVFVEAAEVVTDLKCCIVKNNLETPFISSDNPAVLTNRWSINKSDGIDTSFGLQSSGALLILPLTPKYLFLAYDGDTYNISHISGIVKVAEADDVVALNRHQFLQCASNVFVKDSEAETRYLGELSSISPIRPKVRYKLVYAQLSKINSDGTKEYIPIDPEKKDRNLEAIIHFQAVHPNPKIWPRFLKNRVDGSVYSDGSAVGYIRKGRLKDYPSVVFSKFIP